MPRNPMRQVQEVPKPLGIGLAILFNVFPTLCSTHHRTHRNDEDIHQEMTAIGGKGTAGVRQRGKMLMKRRGHAHTHKEAFSPCQGLQMVKLPDHCSGKLSQLLNALALTIIQRLRRRWRCFSTMPGPRGLLTSHMPSTKRSMAIMAALKRVGIGSRRRLRGLAPRRRGPTCTA